MLGMHAHEINIIRCVETERRKVFVFLRLVIPNYLDSLLCKQVSDLFFDVIHPGFSFHKNQSSTI
jgi:hypothetical protein